MSTFDMPKTGTWEQRGGWVVNALVREFGLTLEQAAGIVGNLGMESEGFTALQEIHPAVPGSRGGGGWAGWTGSQPGGRRYLFEAWAAAHGLSPASDEANYGFLVAELHTTYKNTINSVKGWTTLGQTVFSVGQTYERPFGTTTTNLPGFDDRLAWARRALAGAKQISAGTPPPPPAPVVIDRDLLADIVRAAQRVVGVVPDGDMGKLTVAAIEQAQRMPA